MKPARKKLKKIVQIEGQAKLQFCFSTPAPAVVDMDIVDDRCVALLTQIFLRITNLKIWLLMLRICT